MQRGMIDYTPQQISLYHLAGWTLKLFVQKAEQKQIELHNNIPDDLTLVADLNMMESIYRNLISNALKFTNPGGRITLSASIEHEQVTCSVTDTGIWNCPQKTSRNSLRSMQNTNKEELLAKKAQGWGSSYVKNLSSVREDAFGAKATKSKGHVLPLRFREAPKALRKHRTFFPK